MLPDILAAVGLGLLALGVGMWSIPAALCVVGLVLFLTGVISAARERANRPGPSERVA